LGECKCSGTRTVDPVDEVLNRWDRDESALIGVLQDIQSKVGYLPKDGLYRVAEYLNVPLSRVFHVATFYTAFSLTPRGRHEIRVCTGTACHVRGAPLILAELERQLGIKAGETTEDLRFTLSTVNCVGACALGPAVVIDGEYYSMSRERISGILDRYK